MIEKALVKRTTKSYWAWIVFLLALIAVTFHTCWVGWIDFIQIITRIFEIEATRTIWTSSQEAM